MCIGTYSFVEKGLHTQNIGTRCVVSRKCVVGPSFFRETLNADRYQATVTQFIASLNFDAQYHWFQQDGGTAHTAAPTITFLREFFETRIISQPLWPSRSLDITPPDFFLWGFIKDRVFARHPESTEVLEWFITEDIAEITPQMLCRIYTFAQVARRIARRTTNVPITYSPHHSLRHSLRHSWSSPSKRFFEHESKGTNGDSCYVYEHVNIRTHVKTVLLHRDRGIRMFVQVVRRSKRTNV